jgi:hypothetical protein
MRNKSEFNKQQHEFKINHVLSDGTRVDSIKGRVIPYTPETHMIYELVAKYV